jgi:DNA-binding response OmpR family regulator
MRLLCVGRHEYLSDHLCRYFGALGVQCEAAVGIAGAHTVARDFEPHLVIADCDLLNPAVLEAWSREPALHDVPVLAVSLTRRPEESMPAELCGLAGVIYLPTLDRAGALALLHGARRPLGVDMPSGATFASPRQTAATF